jgi:EamA domain-containing membrane protein RarD
MLLKVIGIVMMLDGVMSAMAAMPMVSTFVYRNLRDQSLVIAHFVVGAFLVLSGRLLMSNKAGRLAAIAVSAAFVIACVETTKFNWPALALRAGYTVFALAVVYRTTLPKT